MIDKVSSKKCNVRIFYDNLAFESPSKSEIFRRIFSIVSNELYAKHKIKCFMSDKTCKNKLELYNTDPELEDNWEEFITEFFDSITTINITKTVLEDVGKFVAKYKSIDRTYECKVSYLIDFKNGNIYDIHNEYGEKEE